MWTGYRVEILESISRGKGLLVLLKFFLENHLLHWLEVIAVGYRNMDGFPIVRRPSYALRVISAGLEVRVSALMILRVLI